MPKKDLFDTFTAKITGNTGIRSRIIRRFRSFVIKDTVEDLPPD